MIFKEGDIEVDIKDHTAEKLLDVLGQFCKVSPIVILDSFSLLHLEESLIALDTIWK
jgi:hypothetical protein